MTAPEYKTIRAQGICEIVEKKSRFIGHALPVQSEAEALALIASRREKFWDASHNVYAYILRDMNTARCSDDGEPQGTAGVPVLDVLKKEGIVDAALVVTRYFGGTLLGAGGLVRAYGRTAKAAVDAAGIITMRLCGIYEFSCGYAEFGRVESEILSRARVLRKDFGADVCMSIASPDGLAAALRQKLLEITAGGSDMTRVGEDYYGADTGED